MKNYSEDSSLFRPVNVTDKDFSSGIEIDYAAYLKRLMRNWYWFVLTLAIALTGAWYYLKQATPLYYAEARMMVEEQPQNSGGFSKEAIAEELGFESSYLITNELEFIRSRKLMEEVVSELGLDVSYVRKNKWRDVEVYRPQHFRLFSIDTFSLSNRSTVQYGSVNLIPQTSSFRLIKSEGDTLSMPYGQAFQIGNRDYKLRRTSKVDLPSEDAVFRIDVKDPKVVAESYQQTLKAVQEGRSNIVTLSFHSSEPNKAKDILDQLIDLYGQEIVEQQSKTGEQTLEFLEERLAFVTRQLNTVESNVASFKTDQGLGVDLSRRGEDYLAQINNADAQLAELQVRRELIENLRNNLVSDSTGSRPLPVASEVTSGILAELITQYNDAIFERDNKLESTTSAHPGMATSEEKLFNLRQSILLSIGTTLDETNERAAKIQERVRPLEQRMNSIPENQRKLTQIMREVDIKRNLFIFLLQKREEAALSIAAQVPNTRIIDRASVYNIPFFPKPNMVYLFAFGLALFLPGSTLFLREIFGTKIETEKEVSRYTNAPVLGRIVRAKNKAGMIMLQGGGRTAISESIRTLRSNLNYILNKEENQVLAVTSSIGGEGKSFLAANLAHSLAMTGQKVVTIGMDLRKPRLSKIMLKGMKVDRSIGLSSYLSGSAEYKQIIQTTNADNLHVILSGPKPYNPSELLLDPRFPELIERLRTDFDIIVIDTPPAGIVSDAFVLKELADATLYVVRMNVTPKKSFERIKEIIRAKRMPRINLVLNDMKAKEVYGKYGSGYYTK